MVEIDPDAHIRVYGYVPITQYLASLFPVPVGVADRIDLKPDGKPRSERDAL
jgi:hypothetical protein